MCRLIQQEYGICLKPDEPFESKVNEIIRTVTEDLESDGEKISTYADSLILLETERLLLRKFDKDDLPALHTIMEKPEVMYAWEHGFTKNDIRKWLNRQLTRYHKDGFGYFAVILKENGYLIGQVGLLKSEIDGKEVIELGYIFNNDYWHQGYCMEAANACIRHAFSMLNADALYCSIRPENLPSVRVAEKLGMVKVGEHAVIYREKEMPHLILKKDNK